MPSTFFSPWPEEPAPAANAFETLAKAIDRLQWVEDDALPSLCFGRLTGRDGAPSLSEGETRLIDALVAENRTALTLLGEFIARGPCIVPPIAAGANEPTTQRILSVIARSSYLQRICYLQARSLIHRGNWIDAIHSIDRLFRFGCTFGNSWSDFSLETYAEDAKKYAYRALVEIAFRSDADAGVLIAGLHLVERFPPNGKLFVETRLRPLVKAVKLFLDAAVDPANALTVIPLLLAHVPIRRALSDARFLDLDADAPGKPQPWYPVMSLVDGHELSADALSHAERWISDRCETPFDNGETTHIVGRALGTLLDESASEPQIFREYLDKARSRRDPTYRLSILLRAAAMRSVFKVKELVSGLSDVAPAASRGRLPPNVLGKALAADVVSAFQTNLSTAWHFWQAALLRRIVCVTMLAVAEYAKRFGGLPPDLDTLVSRGTLRDIPHDPYSGKAMRYDPERKRIFLDATVRNMSGYDVDWDCEDEENAWYINIADD